METVTYVLSGTACHEDFLGNVGHMGPEDLQWMTAGRAIVHSEMPGRDCKEVHGLQLWVNLSKANKMVEPSYQELSGKDVPKVSKDGVHVSIIAGTSLGVTSPVYTRTPTMYLAFKLDPGASLVQAVPEGWNGFVYTLAGTTTVGANRDAVGPHYTVELGPGDSLPLANEGTQQNHFVLIAGQPLNEPVVQWGPFVMNTPEEIMQAREDYMMGKNGFENAPKWKSKNQEWAYQ
eukprot:jgi/Mesvir1/310/Mv22724-RA.1